MKSLKERAVGLGIATDLPFMTNRKERRKLLKQVTRNKRKGREKTDDK
jgi:hypothetical protein